MGSVSKTVVFLSTSREAVQSKAGGLAVWVEALVVEVTQKLCQLDQQLPVGLLLQVGAVPDPAAVIAEDSAEVIEEALAAAEEA